MFVVSKEQNLTVVQHQEFKISFKSPACIPEEEASNLEMTFQFQNPKNNHSHPWWSRSRSLIYFVKIILLEKSLVGDFSIF